MAEGEVTVNGLFDCGACKGDLRMDVFIWLLVDIAFASATFGGNRAGSGFEVYLFTFVLAAQLDTTLERCCIPGNLSVRRILHTLPD